MYSLIIGPLLFRIDPEGWQSYIRSFLVNWNILLIFVVRTFNEKNYEKPWNQGFLSYSGEVS